MSSERGWAGRAARGTGGAALAVAFLALIAPGCSTDRAPGELFDPTDDGTLVVDAVLVVDATFPEVFLSRAIAPNEPYTMEGVAESGAQVRVIRSDGLETNYQEAAVRPGRYSPLDTTTLILPNTRYELLVIAADGRRLTAETTTPPRFEVSEWVLLDETGNSTLRRLATVDEVGGDGVFTDERNRVPYTLGLLEARFQRPDVPAFQVGILNLEEDSPVLIDSEIFDDEDIAELERFVSSPPVRGDEGFLRLPWFAIYFEGRTVIRIHAVDRNWYDLVRTAPELSSEEGAIAFGGNLGDSFERPIFHVEGGIGLFGSSAVDSIGFTVLPEE